MSDLLEGGGPKPAKSRSEASGVGEDAPDRRSAPRRKLVIEVSADLHARILAICATRRIPVNQAVRDVLDRAFPGK